MVVVRGSGCVAEVERVKGCFLGAFSFPKESSPLASKKVVRPCVFFLLEIVQLLR